MRRPDQGWPQRFHGDHSSEGTIPIKTMGFQSFGAMFQRKGGNADVLLQTNELNWRFYLENLWWCGTAREKGKKSEF